MPIALACVDQSEQLERVEHVNLALRSVEFVIPGHGTSSWVFLVDSGLIS